MGLQFEDAKLGFLADVLHRRLETNGGPNEAYLSRLEGHGSKQEIGALAQELTIGETYFFRHMDQFRAFAEVALPERLRVRACQRASEPDRTLRILSAGCASGEEAYSIAILVREMLGESSHKVSVRGVDINPAALEKAQCARFSTWALRETPLDAQRKWFRQEGREVVLNESVRSGVRFEERNLVNGDADLWQPGAFDVVFCRNVIMYFAPENARALIARIAQTLAPGGYLFLGHAETLRGLSQDFHLQHTHETFYYQRKDPVDNTYSEVGYPPVSPTASVAPLPIVVAYSETWVDTIRKAAERIEALAQQPAATGAAPRAIWDLGQAFELLKQERFSEALDVIHTFPRESAMDPDVLLLHAVLLAHGGALSRAEEVCRRLLGIDELSAGAHYVLALCREGAGDRQKAAEHDQVAVYLDPAFAMPHLHLGLLARHAGNHETARRELGQALVLLQREDASRLLLFGGGFNRETLMAVCRTELNAAEAKHERAGI